MSMHDKGGRGDWSQYSLASQHKATSSNQSAGQSSTQSPSHTSPQAPDEPASKHTASHPNHPPPVYGGYVPSASPAITADSLTTPTSTVSTVTTTSTPAHAEPSPSPSPTPGPSTQPEPAPAPAADHTSIVSRVRALYTFEPTESGELAFEKGDIIKVVDRGYENWWRGQLKGRTGIFPVNYVVRSGVMFLLFASQLSFC